MHRSAIVASALAGLVVLAACTELEPVVPPNRVVPNVIVRFGDDSLVMTAPGVARVAVTLEDTNGVDYLVGDSLSKSVQITGPFTWVWDSANRLHYRNMVVTATAPGSGSLILTAEGVADTISLRAEAVSFQTVSLAQGFACGVALGGRLWCWGDNRANVLAAPTPGDCVGGGCQYGGGNRATSPIPARVSQTIANVVTGGGACVYDFGLAFVCGATCAATAAGDWSCWGYLGTTPPPIVLPSKATRAVITPALTASGTPRICFLLDTGSVYCLAHSISAGNKEPAGPIGGPWQYSAFDVGLNHACGVRTDGDVYCWGNNTRGSLGIGSIDANAHPDPERVTAPEKFTAIEAGGFSTCGLSTTGKIYCWGEGYSATGVAPPPACSGVLCQLTPRLLEGGRSYVQISMTTRVCGLTSSGEVDCWSVGGFNLVPVSPPIPQPLRSISVGGPDANGYFTAIGCGVSTTDVLWCWNASSVWKVGQ